MMSASTSTPRCPPLTEAASAPIPSTTGCENPQVAATSKNPLWGFLNAVVTAPTNAIGESLNTRIRKIKAMACASRNREWFRRAILFHLGGLDLLPTDASYPTHTNP